jgi:hypothetical protein
VLLSHESEDYGMRGWRGQPFTTVTESVANDDGTTTVTVTDLAAELESRNQADREGRPR